MNKFQRSWELLKSSLAVMQRNKSLLLFPILTTACTVLVALVFLLPVALQPTGHSYLSGDHWKAVGNSFFAADGWESAASGNLENPVSGGGRSVNIYGVRPLAAAYLALIYFSSMFLATFFNVAFYREIMNGLNGAPVSVSAGLRFACTKWKPIVMWTLFAGLVGWLIKTLEERFGLVGRLILRLVGTAWSIACVFVIPVIVTEESAANPFAVLKQSALTLKKTWGESLIGYAGVSFGGGLVLLLSLVWLGAGIAACSALHLYWLIALVVATWLAGMFVWGYLLGVASQIFRCALYVYASQGTLPAPYTQEMMALAWTQ